MKISVLGKNTRLTKAETRDYVEFLTDMLLSPRQAKSIKVTVKNLDLGRKYKGLCVPTGDEYVKRPKEFLIEINTRQSRASQLKTLAHEMVHVKQYAKGEMYDLARSNEVKFGNQKYSMNTFYWLQPWEIEAYGREYGLYRMYRGIKNWKKNKEKIKKYNLP